MTADPVSDYVISEHARVEIKRRGLSEEIVRSVLNAPDQRSEVREGRVVLQSRVRMGDQAKTYLVRVFVDVGRKPAEVVTAYRTSRISKYWRSGQ